MRILRRAVCWLNGHQLPPVTIYTLLGAADRACARCDFVLRAAPRIDDTVFTSAHIFKSIRKKYGK